MEVPENLLYTQEHEWIRVDGKNATVGITHFAQDQLGDIVFVELPEVGTSIEQENPFGVVESVKTVSDLYAPISGEVFAVNEELDDMPELVNNDPYGKGWLIKINPSNIKEKESLLNDTQYKKFVE